VVELLPPPAAEERCGAYVLTVRIAGETVDAVEILATCRDCGLVRAAGWGKLWDDEAKDLHQLEVRMTAKVLSVWMRDHAVAGGAQPSDAEQAYKVDSERVATWAANCVHRGQGMDWIASGETIMAWKGFPCVELMDAPERDSTP